MRNIMPKRLVSKIDFIRPDKNDKERKRLYKYITEENLPLCYGGKNAGWGVQNGNDAANAGGDDAQPDVAEVDALRTQALEDGYESEEPEFEEIYDDIPAA